MKYQAKSLILAAVLIAGGSTLAAEYLNKKPVRYGRTLLGMAGLGFALSVIDTASDEVAEAFAWLIIITSVVVNGAPILDRINQAASGKVTGKPSGAKVQDNVYVPAHYVAQKTNQPHYTVLT